MRGAWERPDVFSPPGAGGVVTVNNNFGWLRASGGIDLFREYEGDCADDGVAFSLRNGYLLGEEEEDEEEDEEEVDEEDEEEVDEENEDSRDLLRCGGVKCVNECGSGAVPRASGETRVVLAIM